MATSMEVPCLALRGSEGVWLLDGPPKCQENPLFKRDTFSQSRTIDFSRDGSLFGWKTPTGVTVVSCSSLKPVMQIPKLRVVEFTISPQNNLIATWETYLVNAEQPQGAPNLHIWDIKSGQLVKSFYQKKQAHWAPVWSNDEVICCRNVNNELHFYENNNFEVIVNKLHLQKVTEFSIPTKGVEPYHVAAYVPGSKGSPSFVRLYRYPNFGGPAAALANKSFYKADRVDMYWNNKGTAILVLTATDTSADSYYGEQGLHFIGINGDSCLVPRAKPGPVYHVEWSPSSDEFVVTYGSMPAKVTMFNLKCDPVFDFGTGPRNITFYNNQGTMLVLAGFGNLRGNMEFWDVRNKKLVSKPIAQDATTFQWCPDGVHFMTATTSPRLRVGNGVKLWHYSGQILYEWECALNQELWQVLWRPAHDGRYPALPVTCKPVDTADPNPTQQAQPSKYVPPAMRGKPQAPTGPRYRDAYEPPSNQKKEEVAPENMSKSALRNMKRKEAKQRARQEAEEEAGAAAQPVYTPSQAVQPAASITGDPDKDKAIKKLKKKIQEIEKLKTQQASGKKMEKNQLEKIKTQTSLLEDLRHLEIG